MKKSEQYFRNEGTGKKLGSKTARGGLYVVVGSAVRFFLQLLLLSILSRLLIPDDFGLVGMTTVLVGFLSLINNAGLVQATIQRPVITRQEISNLFWLNFSVSLFLAVVLAMFSPLVVKFFGREELNGITLVYAVVVFLQGFAQQHKALLMRSMKYGIVEMTELLTYCMAVFVAVLLGYRNAGYWALVSIPLVVAVAQAFCFPIITGWMPSLPKRNCSMHPYLKYGLNLMGFNGVNYFARNGDNLIVGKFLGAEALGNYSVAYRILLLPMNQLSGPMTKVMLPALSSLQKNPYNYRVAYELALGVLAGTAIPVVVFLFIFSEEFVLVFLGNGWGMAAEIFRWLLPVAFISATNVATGWVYQSLGTTERMLKVAIVKTILLVIAMFVGLNWGVVGVAACISLASVVERIPAVLYCYKGTPLSFKNYLKPQIYPTLFSITGAIIVERVVHVFSSSPLFDIILGALLYVIIITLFYFFSPVMGTIVQTKKLLFEK